MKDVRFEVFRVASSMASAQALFMLESAMVM